MSSPADWEPLTEELAERLEFRELRLRFQHALATRRPEWFPPGEGMFERPPKEIPDTDSKRGAREEDQER